MNIAEYKELITPFFFTEIEKIIWTEIYGKTEETAATFREIFEAIDRGKRKSPTDMALQYDRKVNKTIHVHIFNMKRKLEKFGVPAKIMSVKMKGYYLELADNFPEVYAGLEQSQA